MIMINIAKQNNKNNALNAKNDDENTWKMHKVVFLICVSEPWKSFLILAAWNLISLPHSSTTWLRLQKRKKKSLKMCFKGREIWCFLNHDIDIVSLSNLFQKILLNFHVVPYFLNYKKFQKIFFKDNTIF